MPIRLLTTKFHVPPWRSVEVPRPRLVEQLSTGLREGRKLSLVAAPAGYGKSTLCSEWIHALQGGNWQIAWLTLDAADNDVRRFWGYVDAALRQAVSAAGEAVSSLLDLPQLPSISVILDELLNSLCAQESPVLLFLDDYQMISNPAVHEAVMYFLEHQPHHMHLAISTRQDPPLPLARLRARQQMTEIRARDLRFSREETSQFFTRTMQLDLAEEVVQRMEARTEGWAVGLQLAGLALQNIPDRLAFTQSFSGSHRYVLDYLAEEVLRQQGKELQDFLSHTSVLDQFNAALCQALTGREDTHQMIERLEKGNIFLVPLDHERVWFRYHQLFRDYLRTLLRNDEQAALCKKASQWYEENGLLPEAVQYALASKDSNFSADVMERAMRHSTAWSGGNITLLSSWLAALPEQVLCTRPQLRLNASRIYYLAGQYAQAEKHISQAEEMLKDAPKTPEVEKMQALALLYRGSIACVRGDVQAALEQTISALARLPKDESLAHARAYFNLGSAYELADQMERAVENYLLCSEAAQQAGVHFLAIQASCAAAQVQVKQGSLNEAEQTCQVAIHIAGGVRIPPLGLAYIVLGTVALERNKLAEAGQLLKDGIALSRQGSLMDNAVLGLATLARLQVCIGDIPAALSTIQEARSILLAFRVPMLAAHADAFLARMQLATGKKQEAMQWAALQKGDRKAAEHPDCHGDARLEYAHITLARVFLAANEIEDVPKLLLPVLECAQKAGRFYTCVETMLLLSQYCEAKKDPDAIRWLIQALELAAPRGLVRIFLDHEALLTAILPKARAAAPEFVDLLFDHLPPALGTTHPANARLPEPLSEQELRVLGLVISGKSNQEIAVELYISVGTAKWHVHNILQKLGVSNRPQAIARARELKLA